MPGIVREPMPDLLGRRDKDNGAWEIQDVPMLPGQAMTQVVGHKMRVPVGDNAQERTVRAHEMMHAKCSPGNEWPQWLARGMATERALDAVEEFRVNTLIGRAGFDVKALTDGSEKQTGEHVATNGDWAAGVYATIAFAGTGRLNPFISGVRKHNPEWADAFRVLAQKFVAAAKKVATPVLGSTEKVVHENRRGRVLGAPFAPAGFAYTEAWATLIDQIANPPEDDEDEDEAEGRPDPRGDAQGEGEGEDKPKGGKKPGGKAKAKVKAEDIKKMSPPANAGEVGGTWDTLRLERCPMPKATPGGLGKKRRAADRGRHPRRIHRMLVDPQRRVFDAVKRGNGGVVIIDGSGSMTFDEADILRIVEAAPGATVMVYSSNGDTTTPNAYIVADKGRMALAIPGRNRGNGVDRPAIEWGVAQRQHATAPVVWVTDGHVHGPGQGYSDQMGVDCVKTVLANKVHVRANVDDAVSLLQGLAKGQRQRAWYPSVWKRSWQAVMGKPLR